LHSAAPRRRVRSGEYAGNRGDEVGAGLDQRLRIVRRNTADRHQRQAE
jgi:hypothetical protein